MIEAARPRLTPIFENLKTAIILWWENLKKIVWVYLYGAVFAFISGLIVAIAVGLYNWTGTDGNLWLKVLLSVLAVVSLLFAIYFAIRAHMGLYLLIKKNFVGEEWSIFKETKDLFWPYFGTSLLMVIFTLLWCLLFGVPGIIYAILYSLTGFVFFFEGLRGRAAIRRSLRLVESYWWQVFGNFIVVALAVWLFMFIISLPLSAVDSSSVFHMIWNVVVQAISYLIGPIVLLFTYNIYQDLVKIKK